jgi:hypothetical protein
MAETDTAWRDALLLAPGKVAGVQLLPLTAWHCHAMQMIGVRFGFDSEGRGPAPGELASAIAICRSRWTPDMVGIPAAGWWLVLRLRCRWACVDWRRDAMAMLLHVARYSRQPESESDAKHSTTREIGAPPYFSMAVDLVRKLPGVTIAEALNMPVLLLSCLRAAVAEREGLITCAWNRTEGPTGDQIAAGLELARQAIERARAAKEGAANGSKA